MGWFIFTVVALYLVWRYIRADQFLRAAAESIERVGDNGAFRQEVVGEASYQPHLRTIAGPGESKHRCEATLYPEDDNRYDKNAVAVLIEGGTVGYLSKAHARAYRKRYAGPVRCDARIFGGGDDRQLGVWLDIPPFR